MESGILIRNGILIPGPTLRLIWDLPQRMGSVIFHPETGSFIRIMMRQTEERISGRYGITGQRESFILINGIWICTERNPISIPLPEIRKETEL